MIKEIFPDDRVLVFDSSLYVNDLDTPLSYTMKPAKVVRRYGKKIRAAYTDNNDWVYPDLIDVVFDHRPEAVSEAHFTEYVRLLETE